MATNYNLVTLNGTSTLSNVTYFDSATYVLQKPYVFASPEPQPVEGAALPEDPIAWLRRRVDEVCWKPA